MFVLYFLFSLSLRITSLHYSMSKRYSFFPSCLSQCFSSFFLLQFVFRAVCISHLSANGTVKTTNVSFSQKWHLVSFQIGLEGYLAVRVSVHFITFKGQSDDGL